MLACWARGAAPQRLFVLNNSNKIAGAITTTFTVHPLVVQLRKEMRGPVTHSDGQQTDFQPRESSAILRDCFTLHLQGPVDRLRANCCCTRFNTHSRKSVTCSNQVCCSCEAFITFMASAVAVDASPTKENAQTYEATVVKCLKHTHTWQALSLAGVAVLATPAAFVW